MHITRTIALSLATLTLAASPAIASAGTCPATSTGTSTDVSAPSSATSTVDSAAAWRITVQRATYPTLQSERDRIMHDAERAGFAASVECSTPGDVTTCSQDSFVVSGAPYRDVLTAFRYDPAVVAIDAVRR